MNMNISVYMRIYQYRYEEKYKLPGALRLPSGQCLQADACNDLLNAPRYTVYNTLSFDTARYTVRTWTTWYRVIIC